MQFNRQYHFKINIRWIVTVLSLTINECFDQKLRLIAVLKNIPSKFSI